MSIEIPSGWKLPHKIIGGEDNFELCAIRLYAQVVAMMFIRSGNSNLPNNG